MASGHASAPNNGQCRQLIVDVIQSIENVMLNIRVVLNEVGGLVQEIDSIAGKLEQQCEIRVRKGEYVLDANRNRSDVARTPGVSSQSPYIDYTYLELGEDCNDCAEHYPSFFYNEKYPLWMQMNTWKTMRSVSEMSEVSAGSDSNKVMQYGSDNSSNSWKSISHICNSSRHFPCNISKLMCSHQSKHDTDVNDLSQYNKCCKPHSDFKRPYCGVYEQMMEDRLEEVVPEWNLFSNNGDLTNDDYFSDDYSESKNSVSLSDEHVVRYYKPSDSSIRRRNDDI